jgi:hypothetical protein
MIIAKKNRMRILNLEIDAKTRAKIIIMTAKEGAEQLAYKRGCDSFIKNRSLHKNCFE